MTNDYYSADPLTHSLTAPVEPPANFTTLPLLEAYVPEAVTYSDHPAGTTLMGMGIFVEIGRSVS